MQTKTSDAKLKWKTHMYK